MIMLIVTKNDQIITLSLRSSALFRPWKGKEKSRYVSEWFLPVSTNDLYNAFIPEFLWDGDVFDNRWYYSDFHGLLGLTFPTRIKHTVLNKSLESKVYCGYYVRISQWKLRKITLRHFWQKIRENNGFTKEITK